MSRRAKTDAGLVRVADRFPSLRAIGLAAERFEGYHSEDTWPHRVDVVLLTCVLRGRGVHVMAGRRCPVRPGSVGITLYGQEHHLVTGPGGLEVVNVYLDLKRHPLPVLPAGAGRVLSTLIPPHPGLVNRMNRRLDFQFRSVSRLRMMLDWLLEEQAHFEAGEPHAMAQLLVGLLVELCRLAPVSERAPAGVAWVERVRQFIDASYDRPIGLGDLVRLARVTPEHLARQFKAHTGSSPIAYLNDRRVQAAAWLLRTTPRSVTDIALTCGFNELTHFNRLFKRTIGQTPTGYRRMRQGP